MKVPLKWRIHWFLMGMASVFGVRQTPEQIWREIQQCVDEMMEEDAQ